MVRRRNLKTLSNGKTALALALEAGKDIKGMKGFIGLEDYSDDETGGIFVQVRCLGLETEDCGLKVKVEIVSGAGILSITPCRWLDTVEQINDHVELRKRQAKAVVDYRSIWTQPHYHKDKATFLDNYVNLNITGERLAGWLEHWLKTADDQGGKKKITKTEQFGASALRELTRVAVCVANDLNAEQEPEEIKRYH